MTNYNELTEESQEQLEDLIGQYGELDLIKILSESAIEKKEWIDFRLDNQILDDIF